MSMMVAEAFTIEPTPIQPFDAQMAEELRYSQRQNQAGGVDRAIRGAEGPGV